MASSTFSVYLGPPELQIKSFTSESYHSIKRRQEIRRRSRISQQLRSQPQIQQVREQNSFAATRGLCLAELKERVQILEAQLGFKAGAAVPQPWPVPSESERREVTHSTQLPGPVYIHEDNEAEFHSGAPLLTITPTAIEEAAALIVTNPASTSGETLAPAIPNVAEDKPVSRVDASIKDSEIATLPSSSKAVLACWSSADNERLVHLKDVTQLRWKRLSNYFPAYSEHYLRLRYQQLARRRSIVEAKPHKSERNVATTCCTTSSKEGDSKAEKRQPRKAAQNSRKTTTPRSKQSRAKTPPTRPINSSHTLTKQMRTSRSGRTIRHPYRDRPYEGYM